MFSRKRRDDSSAEGSQVSRAADPLGRPLDTHVLNLAADEIFAKQHVPTIARFGAGTHPGKVRSRNEDHYLLVRRRRSRQVIQTNMPDNFPDTSEEDGYVMVVADGIGGGGYGHLASRLALEAGWALGGDEINWSFRATPKEIDDVLAKMKLYPLLIHKALIHETRQHPELRGMGTTFTAAYTIGNDAFITHVGDSRAILIRRGQLQQLTTDQTLAEYYAKANELTRTGEEFKRMSHVLVSCLGAVDDSVDVETHHFELQHGDVLLLCSDGLTDMVSNDQIVETVQQYPDPQRAVDRLIEQALDAGGRDNVTLVLGKYTMPDVELEAMREAPTPAV